MTLTKAKCALYHTILTKYGIATEVPEQDLKLMDLLMVDSDVQKVFEDAMMKEREK